MSMRVSREGGRWDWGRRGRDWGEEGAGPGIAGQAPYQGFLQPLLVVAVELLCLPCSAHRPVQGFPQVHESGLVLGQLVSGACYQRLVPLPAPAQLLLHMGQHWPRPRAGTVTWAVTPGACQSPSTLPS